MDTNVDIYGYLCLYEVTYVYVTYDLLMFIRSDLFLAARFKILGTWEFIQIYVSPCNNVLFAPCPKEFSGTPRCSSAILLLVQGILLYLRLVSARSEVSSWWQPLAKCKILGGKCYNLIHSPSLLPCTGLSDTNELFHPTSVTCQQMSQGSGSYYTKILMENCVDRAIFIAALYYNAAQIKRNTTDSFQTFTTILLKIIYSKCPTCLIVCADPALDKRSELLLIRHLYKAST